MIYPRTLPGFFSYFKLHLHDIFRVNLLLIIGNFPIFLFLYAMTGNLNYTSTAPTSQLFPVLHGVFLHGESSPAFAALYGVHGIQGTLSVTTTATTVMMLLALLLALTLGPITTAATYIFRNLLRGEPIFFFSDIRYVIKRNLSQSIILGNNRLCLHSTAHLQHRIRISQRQPVHLRHRHVGKYRACDTLPPYAPVPLYYARHL